MGDDDDREPAPIVHGPHGPAHQAGGGALSLIGSELRIPWQRSNNRPTGHVQETSPPLYITTLVRPLLSRGLLPSECNDSSQHYCHAGPGCPIGLGRTPPVIIPHSRSAGPSSLPFLATRHAALHGVLLM